MTTFAGVWFRLLFPMPEGTADIAASAPTADDEIEYATRVLESDCVDVNPEGTVTLTCEQGALLWVFCVRVVGLRERRGGVSQAAV